MLALGEWSNCIYTDPAQRLGPALFELYFDSDPETCAVITGGLPRFR